MSETTRAVRRERRAGPISRVWVIIASAGALNHLCRERLHQIDAPLERAAQPAGAIRALRTARSASTAEESARSPHLLGRGIDDPDRGEAGRRGAMTRR